MPHPSPTTALLTLASIPLCIALLPAALLLRVLERLGIREPSKYHYYTITTCDSEQLQLSETDHGQEDAERPTIVPTRSGG